MRVIWNFSIRLGFLDEERTPILLLLHSVVRTLPICRAFRSALGRTRTCDLLIRSQLMYVRLSLKEPP
jgi:hypothetical protein